MWSRAQNGSWKTVGDRILPGTHLCLFYDNDAQRNRMITDLFRAGWDCGEQVAYVTDTRSVAQVYALFNEMNAFEPTLPTSAFKVADAKTAFYPQGRFDPQDQLSAIAEFDTSARQQGYAGVRVSGEMSWSLREVPGAERVLEYEAKITDVLAQHQVTAICQYDLRRFDAQTISEVLKAHPVIIVNGQIMHNPFYTTPQILLQALRRSTACRSLGCLHE